MAGYIGSKSSVTLVDGYTEAEADAEFVTKAGDTMSGNLDVTGTVTGSTGITTGVNHGNFTPVTSGTTGARINANGNGMLRLASGGVDKMYVLDSGNVGIGDSNPLSILHVGTGASANVPITFAPSTGGNIEFRNTSSTGTFTITNGNGSSENLRIDATGAVTMPNQPAFLVKPTTSSQQLNIAVNQAVNIVFGTEVFDQNADFSSSAFTAPVTGKYFFSVGLAVQNLDSAANFYEIYIRASNRTLGFTMDPDFGQDAAYWQFNASGLIDMDAGDTCDIQIYQGAGSPQTDIRTVSYFSGYLVA